MKGVVELPDMKDCTKTGWLKNMGQENWAGERSCTEVLQEGGKKLACHFF